jgi:hypothetical protein
MLNEVIKDKDNRSSLADCQSITFRVDIPTKRIIQARASAYGYKNVSGYLRDASIGNLPQVDVE